MLFSMAEQKNKAIPILPIVLESRTEKEIRRRASAGDQLSNKQANREKTKPLPYIHENRTRKKSTVISVNWPNIYQLCIFHLCTSPLFLHSYKFLFCLLVLFTELSV